MKIPDNVECNKRRRLEGRINGGVLGYGTLAPPLLFCNKKAAILAP